MPLPPVAAAREPEELKTGEAVRYSSGLSQQLVEVAGMPGDCLQQPTAPTGRLPQAIAQASAQARAQASAQAEVLGRHPVFRNRCENALTGRRLDKFSDPRKKCAEGSAHDFAGHAIEISHAATIFKAPTTAAVLEIFRARVQAYFVTDA